MFFGGLILLFAAAGLLGIFLTNPGSSWVILALSVFLLAAALDLLVFCFTHRRLTLQDLRRKATAARFQFHSFGEIPQDYSKAGYVVESIDDLIDLISMMRDMEVTRASLLIQSVPGEVRSDGLDPRTVIVNGHGFVGTLSRPLAA